MANKHDQIVDAMFAKLDKLDEIFMGENPRPLTDKESRAYTRCQERMASAREEAVKETLEESKKRRGV